LLVEKIGFKLDLFVCKISAVPSLFVTRCSSVAIGQLQIGQGTVGVSIWAMCQRRITIRGCLQQREKIIGSIKGQMQYDWFPMWLMNL
jgi:hypothetical protein